MKFYKKGDKKLLNAWAFYDWANSVYPLVISTAIFPIYFKSITKGNGAKNVFLLKARARARSSVLATN